MSDTRVATRPYIIGSSQTSFVVPAGGFTPVNTETTTWKNAVVGDGGTVSDTELGYVDTLITNLKGHSLWTMLDRLWLYASENTFQAGRDIVNIGTLTATGMSFTANQGYTGGATKFIDTLVKPSTFVGNISLNSTIIGVYDRTNRLTQDVLCEMGCINSTSTSNLLMQLNSAFGGVDAFYANDALVGTTAIGTSQGLWVCSRTSSTQVDNYRNASSTPISSNGANNSVSLPDENIYCNALNNAGSLAQESTDQIAACVIGGGMTGAQYLNFANDLNTYMTSVGANVF